MPRLIVSVVTVILLYVGSGPRAANQDGKLRQTDNGFIAKRTPLLNKAPLDNSCFVSKARLGALERIEGLDSLYSELQSTERLDTSLYYLWRVKDTSLPTAAVNVLEVPSGPMHTAIVLLRPMRTGWAVLLNSMLESGRYCWAIKSKSFELYLDKGTTDYGIIVVMGDSVVMCQEGKVLK
jgi:hypothetical protein